MNSLQRIQNIGKGSYGKVYSCKFPNNDNIYAYKRNMADLTALGFGSSIREIDILIKLKGYPFIIDILDVKYENPFDAPMSPINAKNLKDDKVHFLLEYVEHSGKKIFQEKTFFTMEHGKLLSCQLLLAIEHMHANNICHRDLKPDNILITQSNGWPVLKIIDFGMGQFLCGGKVSTPNVTTSWYRAPEICASLNYTNVIDIWSAGCIIFEIFGSKELLRGTSDDNESILNMILTISPIAPNKNYVKFLQTQSGLKIKIAPNVNRRTYVQQMLLTPPNRTSINRTNGNTDQLDNLMNLMLTLNPSERPNASQLLNHPFFKSYKTYVQEAHEKYPPVPKNLPYIKIIDCVERKWAVCAAFTVYNNRQSLNWYEHRIIFHSIDIFDRYIEWAFLNLPLGEFETTERGRLHSSEETELRYYVCLYITHKYNSSLTFISHWNEMVPEKFNNPTTQLIVEEFEKSVVKDALNYNIYRDTLFEIADHFATPMSSELVHKLLEGYGNINSWENKSVRALYREIMKIEVAAAT